MTLRLIRRLTLIAVFAVLAMWSCRLALAQPTQPATTPPTQPLSIARQGYFFVGGHLFPFNGDQAMAGQMFVQYQVPAGTAKPYPVVMVHGGGQTGTNFLGTPDGRPGWNEWFLRQGYAVYIVDQPARGRSAYYPAVQGSTAPSLAHGTEQRFTAPEKYNLWPQAKLHTQWPGSGNQGDPIFDQFFASQETSITDNILMDESNRDDLVALLERIGPAIMLTHSRSGPFGWLVADARPGLVRAILAIEPNGPPFFDVVPSAATPTFVRAWGIAYAKLHFDPPVEQPASLAPGLDTADDGPGHGALLATDGREAHTAGVATHADTDPVIRGLVPRAVRPVHGQVPDAERGAAGLRQAVRYRHPWERPHDDDREKQRAGRQGVTHKSVI